MKSGGCFHPTNSSKDVNVSDVRSDILIIASACNLATASGCDVITVAAADFTRSCSGVLHLNNNTGILTTTFTFALFARRCVYYAQTAHLKLDLPVCVCFICIQLCVIITKRRTVFTCSFEPCWYWVAEEIPGRDRETETYLNIWTSSILVNPTRIW